MRYLPIVIAVVGTLLLIKLLNISYPVEVISSTTSKEISVVGEGKVEVVPDTAYIDTGITVTDASSVEEAQESINETNDKIVEAIKKIGIPKESMKTSNYSIYPNYSYEPGQQNRITGYNANVTISIKLSNTALTSRVIEEATKAGANQILGTRFTIDDPGSFRDEARKRAIDNAKDQANKLSKQLDIRLGKVVGFEEMGTGSTIIPLRQDLGAGGLGRGTSPAIETGTQTVTSIVTLRFERR